MAARAIFIDDFAGNVDAAVALGMSGVLVGENAAEALTELRELLRTRSPA